MARRTLAWLFVTPIAAAGVLTAHALAYAATGTAAGPEHDYLDHAPQVVGLLVSFALLGLAVQERSLRPFSARWVAPLAPLAFVCQEHLERLVHTGELPWLLTTPSFLVGLVFQLPVAVACVLVVRLVIGTLDLRVRSATLIPTGIWLPLPSAPVFSPPAAVTPRRRGRAPPALLGA